MGKVAFVFPGQGAQYVGMGSDLARSFPEARQIMDRASECLGIDLARICFEGPEEVLTQTFNAQPAILATSVLCYEVLRSKGFPDPDAVAGFSLGEYTALVVAGSLEFEDAVQLVRRRGQLMDEAVPNGAGGMVAVLGLELEVLESICKTVSSESGLVVEVANINCPGQLVISGQKGALSRAAELARLSGAKRCVPLAVSGPFHSSLMKSAAEHLGRELARVKLLDPQIPVVVNATADYATSSSEVRQKLIEQMYSPVLWEASVRRLLADGYDTFIEVGPGTVLSGLIKRIEKTAAVHHVEDVQSLAALLDNCKGVC